MISAKKGWTGRAWRPVHFRGLFRHTAYYVFLIDGHIVCGV
ncbi:hypothetical protein CLOLEP_00379 [[Clostridium] leptum DSM 753]|uniref:Uncharacterized protein n=1 Tax=[Clostridium] leptum DSM 753 TaxID=428125 RepID=A7VPA3_9FIRM|nr:hypothetical protein CLOLEP_00379 [[Clostridium] leptum DSM 753]